MDQQIVYFKKSGKCGYTIEKGDKEEFLKLSTVLVFFDKHYNVINEDTSSQNLTWEALWNYIT